MKDIAERLKLKSTDAALRWCKSKDIDMMKRLNKWMVPESALILALDEEFIDQLKEKYGIRWIDYYDAYKTGDLKRLHELKNAGQNQKESTNGFYSNKLLKRINYGKS